MSLTAFRKNLYHYRARQRGAGGAGGVRAAPAASAPAGLAAVGDEPVATSSVLEPNELQAVPGQAIPAALPFPAPSFDDALDKRKRDALGETYLTRRKPLIGKSLKKTES